MTAIPDSELLDRLHDAGGRLWLEGDAIKYSAPRGALGPELLQALRERKEALREWLRTQSSTPSAGVRTIPRARRDGPLPLSFSQRQLWMVEQLDPGRPLYNMTSALRLEGPLDADTFERAWEAVVRRHEILRTTFHHDKGAPFQRVREDAAAPFERIDLAALRTDAREREAQRLAEEESARPFDLEGGPLARMILVRLDATAHVLVLNMHHIVSDAWSLGVVVRELLALYSALAHGRPSPLPDLPIQVADHAIWQQQQMVPAALQEHIAHFRAALEGVPPLDLATDHPRPPVPSHRGASVTCSLDANLTERLQSLARGEGATLFMVLLAALQVLLARHADQNDFALGVAVAGRDREELEPLIGYFVHLLPIRASLDGAPTFLELLRRTREAVLDAFQHQDVPFEKLVDALTPHRDPSRPPLVQAGLAVQNVPISGIDGDGLACHPIALPNHAAHFDIWFVVTEVEGHLDVRVDYSRDLFEEATVVRLLAHLRVLLDSATSRPGCAVGALSMMPEDERRALAAWSKPAVHEPRESTIHTLFEERAAHTPDAIALLGADRTLTYRQLDQRANRLARALRARGVGLEVPVGLFVERSIEAIVGMLAILKAGGFYVPLDPSHPRERLASLIRDVDLRFALVQPHVAGAWPDPDTCILRVDADESAVDEGACDGPRARASADHAAYVIFTSGSTGKPKGVIVPHRGVVRLALGRTHLRIGPEDVLFQNAPLTFDVSTAEIWCALLRGARLAVPGPGLSSLEEAGEAFRRYGVTTLFLTSAPFHQIIDTSPEILSGVRSVVVGGDVLSPAHVNVARERLPNTQIFNGYGPTENTTLTTLGLVRGAVGGRSVPLGSPVDATRVYVLDDHLRPSPIGVVGELYTAGDGLARGYAARPAMTAERFLPDPFAAEPGARMYRTGDRVRWLEDGTLEFLGRRDHQVKIRGLRIELGEIEHALLAHPAVAQAVVVAREDVPGHKRLCAYVLPADAGRPPAASAVRAHLQTSLPEAMLPGAIVVLDRWPLGKNGKLDRRALPRPEERAEPTVWNPPRTPEERSLAEIWHEVLGGEAVSLDDNFFDRGGDSMLSIRLLALARERGLRFSLTTLMRSGSLRAIAEEAALRNATDDEQASVPAFALLEEADRRRVPEGVEDAYPLTALQHGTLFHGELSPEDTTYRCALSVRVEAHVDPRALSGALEGLVAAHPILRTSFELHGYSTPLQLVHRQASVPLVVEDLGHLASDAQEAWLEACFQDDMAERFDWTKAPMLRAYLYRLGERCSELVLSFHHAILDGWSVATFSTELVRALTAAEAPREAAMQISAAPPFRNYVALEQAALRSEASRTFWRTALEGAPWLEMPRRGAADAGLNAPRETRVPIAAETSAALRRLAKDAGVPLQSVLLAAHLCALRAATGEGDLVTGVATHGRPEARDSERTLGLFVNSIPLRVQLGCSSWGESVRDVFQAEQAAYPHRRYPLAAIQRDLGRPLFEVLFTFTHFHVLSDAMTQVATHTVGSRTTAATNFPFSASFSVSPVAQDVDLVLATADARMAGDVLETFARLYAWTLERMARDPRGRCDVANDLPPWDRERLARWNARASVLEPAPIPERFHAQVDRTPNAIAIVDDDATLTYAQLDRRANRLAHRLRAAGVGPEHRVAMCLPRGADLLVALLAILKAGGAYVPLDPSYPDARLAFMLADAGCTCAVTTRALAARLTDVPLVRVDAAEAELASSSEERPEPGLHPDNLAYVIYTSGSTGVPKGVLVPHRAVASFDAAIQEAIYDGFPAPLRVGVTASISFDASVEHWIRLLHGDTLILVPEDVRADPPRLFALFRERQVEAAHFTPSHLERLLDAGFGRPDVAAPRLVLVGGEAIDRALWERLSALSDVAFIDVYGPTECTVEVTARRITPGSRPALSEPLSNVGLRILAPSLLPAPIGLPGEIALGGPQVARGYLGRPALTAERFVPDPFSAVPGARMYRTGDLACVGDEGLPVFLGRRDHQVKIRGHRIELGEIEHALLAHPDVGGAAVAPAETSAGERMLVAYVVPRSGCTLDAAAVRTFLATRLLDAMIPAAFVFLAALPLTPSGKVDRSALGSIDRGAPGPSPGALVLPRDPLELELVELWEDLLGVRPIGVRDDFFARGGHSLNALRMLAGIEQRFGKSVPLPQLFQEGTIEAFATVLRRGSVPTKASSTLVPLETRAEGPPLFCVHGIGGSALSFLPLARALGDGHPVHAFHARGRDDDAEPFDDVDAMADHYVEQLRAVRPMRPVWLLGWSFGGAVVLEMARRLEREGTPVAGLILLDSWLPGPGDREDLPGAERLALFAREHGIMTSHDDERAFAGPDGERLLTELAVVQGILPAADAHAQVVRALRLYAAHARAFARYRPGPVGTRIALVRPEDLAPFEGPAPMDPTADWEAMSPMPILRHTSPGHHFTMLRPPYVLGLAAIVRERLAGAS